MNSRSVFFLAMVLFLIIVTCKNEIRVENTVVPNKMVEIDKPLESDKASQRVPQGMVWILGGTFNQGAVAQDKMAMDCMIWQET
ncbi:hypothetical protein [Cellulophaga sp. L1A9]|uniref:hypothetical protein n=1 Tax=Cellulophaga sp. L1A9 TaxID=2686362 RepID=UPI00131AE114|nr:hypothetical protein [Cellulophaga sp. L1A9]